MNLMLGVIFFSVVLGVTAGRLTRTHYAVLVALATLMTVLYYASERAM